MRKSAIRRSIAAAAVALAGAATLAGVTTANAATATATLEREASHFGTANASSSSSKFCKYKVTGNGVALRKKPSSSSARLGLLYKGDKVYGYVKKYNTKYYKFVRSPKHDKPGHKATGYVAKRYLKATYCTS